MSPDRPFSPLLTDMGFLHTVMATTVALLDRILYGARAMIKGSLDHCYPRMCGRSSHGRTSSWNASMRRNDAMSQATKD